MKKMIILIGIVLFTVTMKAQIIIDMKEKNDSLIVRDIFKIIADKESYILNKFVCLDYAKEFKRMCDSVGIKCIVVGGWSYGIGHAWNHVRLGSDENSPWYPVDVTFGDLGECIDWTNCMPSWEDFLIDHHYMDPGENLIGS
jgi:hypothetical protein